MAGVSVTIGGDFRKLDELDSKIKSTLKKATEGFQHRIGHKMFDGLLAAANRIPDLIGKSITAASDLNEVTSKTSVVFNDSAAAMMAWAENSAEALGQSRSAALGAAADFGNLFRAMSVAPATAAAMSREMVELATDLASFNNTTTDEAIVAIGAALRGESEPIRRYGVLLDEATLKAQAFAMGLSDGKAQLTPATKALAAHAAILAQTGTAQGDFARTSEGAANSARIIKAQIENAAASFGGAFLPAVEDLAAKLKTVDFEGLATGLASALKAALSVAPALAGIAAVMVAMKIGAFVAGTWQKVAAMTASAAAATAEASAMRTATGATNAKAAADTAATTAARRNMAATAALGGVMLVATAAAQGMAMYASKLAEENGAMADSFDRGNAALKKFNAETLRGEVTSRDDIAKKLVELEKEKQEIYAAAKTQGKDLDSDLYAKLMADTELTIKLLDQQGKRLAATSDAQLQSNSAKVAAIRAEQEHAEAIKLNAKAYEEAKKKFDDALAGREKDRFEALGLEEKIAELNKAEAKIRDGFNSAIKANFSNASAEELQKEIGANPNREGLEQEMVAVNALLDLEIQRAKLQDELKKKNLEQAESREKITAAYNDELAALTAQIDGNDKNLAKLEREAFIREKIAEMTKAGIVDAKTAETRANNLANARDLIIEQERRQPGLDEAREAGREARLAIGGEEAATAERIADLIGKGLTENEAKKTARLEGLTQQSSLLQSRREGASNNQSIITGSQGRIGAGGGVYVAGLDYQRQLASIGREQLAVSKQIAAELSGNRIFD